MSPITQIPELSVSAGLMSDGAQGTGASSGLSPCSVLPCAPAAWVGKWLSRALWLQKTLSKAAKCGWWWPHRDQHCIQVPVFVPQHSLGGHQERGSASSCLFTPSYSSAAGWDLCWGMQGSSCPEPRLLDATALLSDPKERGFKVCRPLMAWL